MHILHILIISSPSITKNEIKIETYKFQMYEKIKFQILVLYDRLSGFPTVPALRRTEPKPHMGRLGA